MCAFAWTKKTRTGPRSLPSGLVPGSVHDLMSVPVCLASSRTVMPDGPAARCSNGMTCRRLGAPVTCLFALLWSMLTTTCSAGSLPANSPRLDSNTGMLYACMLESAPITKPAASSVTRNRMPLRMQPFRSATSVRSHTNVGLGYHSGKQHEVRQHHRGYECTELCATTQGSMCGGCAAENSVTGWALADAKSTLSGAQRPGWPDHCL